VECGILSIENYKKIIEMELVYEKALLERIDKDDMIKNKLFVKTRISERVAIIEGEIAQEVVQEEEPEEVKEVEEEKVEVDEVEEVKSIESVPIVEVKQVAKVEPAKPKVEEKKSLIKNETLYAKLKARAEEYKRANDYFNEIDNQKQADDSRKRAVEIIMALKKMEKGDEIDEFDLPMDVSPDYICDCSKSDRANHFNTIIKELTKMKNNYSDELNAKIEEMKQTVKARDIEKNVNRKFNFRKQRYRNPLKN
jgi:hypothetical protein